MRWTFMALMALAGCMSQSIGLENASVATLRAPGQGDDEDNTCPFIYDKYDIDFGGFKIELDLNKAGISHGYYCSVKQTDFPLKFTFGNCSCPFARYCDDTWGLARISGADFNIGRCAFYNWVLLVPFTTAFLFAGLCACCCARRKKVVREVIVVRGDSRGDYVNLN